MTAAPWTEAHRREALVFLARGIEASAMVAPCLDDLPLTIAESDILDEYGFRRAVCRLYDIDGEEKAVRRVRDLAEGRKVREATRGYRIAFPDGGRSNVVTKQQALDGINPTGRAPKPGLVAVPVRITRIRRAPR